MLLYKAFLGKKKGITAIQTAQFVKGNTPLPSPFSTSKSPTPAFDEAMKKLRHFSLH